MATTTNYDAISVSHSWRVAVQAKYLGDTRRVKVGRMGEKDPNAVTVAWNDALDHNENYEEAIRLYLIKMEWGGRWTIGTYNGGAVATWAGWAE